ncbi:MAG: peptidase and in kexin sedolisin [Clostridia bacterium]|jgi:subtilisin family serine protease|nr:peptidase and in kexin sedolisin [Clostridia bacterium]
MRFPLRQNNEIVFREYLLQTVEPIENLRAAYPRLLFRNLADQIVNVEVPAGAESEIRRLSSETNFLRIPTLYGLYAREALIESNILALHNYPFGPLTGQGIIIGFVDTGIDYTNKLFKNPDNTTRILKIWDQTLTGNVPAELGYGAEFNEAEINRALQSDDPYEIVPTRDEIGHGTFLAGVAAGDDKTETDEYIGGAPDAAIVMVKLRQAQVYLKQYYLIKDSDIAYQDNDFLAGINYLLQAAVEFQRPLVICIGIGNNDGAHSGSTIVERYLNSLTTFPNLIIVVAAGNEANSGHHFSGLVTRGQKQDIEINVSPEELRGYIVNIWASISDKLSVSIRSPIGQVINKVPVIANETTAYSLGLEQSLIIVTYNYPDIQTGAENIIVRFQNPTPGIWTITVYGEEIVNGRYNVWLQRNDFMIADTRFLTADTLVTICIPSSSEYLITVGAYNYVDQSIYVGSGRGPTADNKIKPDLIAPGVNVTGPQPGGGYTTYVGTSTAAAITASAAVLLMQWAVIQGNLEEMNTRIARGILIRGAERRRGIDYPNAIEGYGRLDLRNSIGMI